MNIQPAVGDHYTDYCIVPDPGVSIAAEVAEDNVPEYLQTLGFPAAAIDIENRFTTNEEKILYGLVMILLNKTIGSDIQYNQVVDNRLSALNRLSAVCRR